MNAAASQMCFLGWLAAAFTFVAQPREARRSGPLFSSPSVLRSSGSPL
jgi:hypothetical protein